MQVQDRGARFGSGDRLVGDVPWLVGQVRAHRRRMNRAGYGTGDDDFVVHVRLFQDTLPV